MNEIEKSLAKRFEELEDISFYNTQKVLKAFLANKISLASFNGTSGYGYGDMGRENLCKVFANIFGTQSAIVSPHINSGTHALTLALFGLLKSGDTALSISGKPYDTLKDVINGEGGLGDYKINFETVPLKNGNFDTELIKKKIKKLKPKIIYLQRSRGYEWRESINISKMKEIFSFVRTLTNALIVVDNCYGEFTEKLEPTDVGANVVVGSLIKNPGGGIAPTGAYIAGTEQAINLIYARLNSPSLCGEVGSYESGYRLFFQGIFVAPHTVKEAMKGVLLVSETLRKKGFRCLPEENSTLSDIICSVEFGSKEKMLEFCNLVQKNSPIDSFVKCEPSQMPGYNDPVIMAAGTFVQGASLELSCDGTVKPPYIAYLQGGLTYEHVKILTSSF